MAWPGTSRPFTIHGLTPCSTILGMKGYTNPQLLVTPRDLAAELQKPEASRPLGLDLRAGDAYAAGHIPGAIQINLWGLSLTDTDPAPLNAFMWMIEHVLQIH